MLLKIARVKRFVFFIFLINLFFSIFSFGESREKIWKKIDEGLYLAEIDPEKITLIKIDPKFYSFKLLCASELGNMRMTIKKWGQKYNLISAINAGMFQADGFKSVGYMKNFNHLNNPRLNTKHKAVLAFNPIDETVPEIQIIDLTCQEFETLKFKYNTLIQGIRMISCRQENVWSKQNKRWSISALGIDKDRNALFIFSESPYSVHDFINFLLSLPISIYNAMYLEGGPEATLYFNKNGIEFEKIGTYIIDSTEEQLHKIARPIPNVIGIIKK
jgi:exopolysaccharide biosynthesis protein